MHIEPLMRSEAPVSSDALLLWLVSAQSRSLSSPHAQPQALAISPFKASGSNLLLQMVGSLG